MIPRPARRSAFFPAYAMLPKLSVQRVTDEHSPDGSGQKLGAVVCTKPAVHVRLLVCLGAPRVLERNSGAVGDMCIIRASVVSRFL
ncbi:hypothetical protein IscW_ISCW018832 [Ixodes scapularis]|uniref:Uncharacterized protein n=1 Tax=Ixodes scapularis TaxID=6945 RepID=B7PLK4_IXOSC|nr:hypothetical protein IscW_ISCW018832 [Ixodes scapularis]|eukprot:XP_002434652.1 hypothetical protein IscW_ISCW018832 [Ixodes scapularis]